MRARNGRSGFGHGSGCYECTSCHRKTRQTGGDNDDLRLCEECYDIAGLENRISDQGDADGSCAAEIKRLTAQCIEKGGKL